MTETATVAKTVETTTCYLSAVLDQTPRLLGLLNRNPGSSTYGCFDRNYWHYRVVDTPSARCQEAVLTLALLHQIPGTAYAGRESLLTWLNAGMQFWLTRQHPNGSFDEWYPYEQSFVATAFSSYAVSEVMLLVGSAVEHRQAVAQALIKAGQWLLRREEHRALNQVAGSALALYNIFLITGDRAFEKGASDRIAWLRKARSPEGWLAEYGGADLGYLSLTVAYVAKLYRKSRWPHALELALGAVEFLKEFLHHHVTSGGAYGSRLTAYLLPDGFEILAGESASALAVSHVLREALRREQAVSLASFDDRYVSYVAYNFLEAFLYGADASGSPASVSELPSDTRPVRRTDRYFPQAGLAVIHWDRCEGVVNVRRGGACTFVFEGGTSISDSGAIVVDQRRRVFYSGFWDGTAESVVEGKRIVIRGRLRRVRDIPLTPWRNTLFRVVQLTVGRSGRLAVWTKQFLRSLLIMPSGERGMRYERSIEFNEGRLVIRDSIHESSGPLHIDRVIVGPQTSFLYTPSSKYFAMSEVREPPAATAVPAQPNGFRIDITRQYDFSGQLQRLTMKEEHVQRR